MKILIVDDNPTNLKLMSAQLECEGHVVTQAHDGVEALERLDQQPMDAVISDILMPRMDGYRLCREIRKHDRLRNLPTIIYSATFTSTGDVDLALSAGADKYLSKPASVEIIIAALHEAMAMPHAAPTAGVLPEVEVLKEYSQRLVNKLAEKKSDLEHANAELQATRDQLAHLLKYSPALIYSLKMNGERVVPRFISENMTQLLGFTMVESCSFDWWMDHVHPEDRDRAVAGVAETISTGAWTAEYRIRHKAGHYLWVEDNRRLVRDAGGRPTDIIVVWTNITERKRNQSEILRAQRLESIGTVACGMAHDLNNVLVPILLATDFLRLATTDKATKSLEIIESSARLGANMVKQLLMFVKGAEGDRLPIQPQRLLENVAGLLKISLPKNIILQTDYGKDLRPVLGDATQLQQVLFNLCGNARDAMPEGGTLTMKVENIEIETGQACAVGEANPGDYVAWSVADNGTGIPAKILERIFEPFFSTKGPDRGTGLGLSTVSGIVKSHGGFIQVLSELGNGSTFTVYLPVAGPAGGGEGPPPESKTRFRGNGETVLVVEDDVTLSKLLRALLTRLNFKVLTAANGSEALLQVAENGIDLRLVITDVHMPNMDGLEFTRLLKGRLPRAGIIVTSGNLEPVAADEFRELGVVALLEKPFDAEQMIAVLKQVFKG